ncbi:hypothetical protein KCP71_05940 [Salmonella enterica subsp. enterica]|nr:hypothetical protein KCP71_05940 [Salmonella enterica subsp. enterica]
MLLKSAFVSFIRKISNFENFHVFLPFLARFTSCFPSFRFLSELLFQFDVSTENDAKIQEAAAKTKSRNWIFFSIPYNHVTEWDYVTGDCSYCAALWRQCAAYHYRGAYQ